MVFVVILLLENNKYYIEKTINNNFNLETYANSNKCLWIQKYKPIKIIDIITICDNITNDKCKIECRDICEDVCEDIYINFYMMNYGIDNIRGGKYSNIELNKEELQSLKIYEEIFPIKCKFCQNNFYNHLKKIITIDEIDDEINRLNILYKKIDKLKKKINDLQNITTIINGEIIIVSLSIDLIEEFELYNYMNFIWNNNYDIEYINKQYEEYCSISKYKMGFSLILENFQKMYETYIVNKLNIEDNEIKLYELLNYRNKCEKKLNFISEYEDIENIIEKIKRLLKLKYEIF